MAADSHLPHSLRLSVFFLRLAIGLNFFYLGWSALFNQPLEFGLRQESLSALYFWLGSPAAAAWFQVAAWAFLLIGVCVTIGLFTRVAAFVGLALILASYLPTISFAHFAITQLINDELIIFFCLLVLIFGKAGNYFGVDKFLRWSRRRRE
jgi:uncharacterized membrane protein YphA (DoxX/SURF4 family)